MISMICLICLINIVFFAITNAIPYERYRRQLNSHRKDGLPYEGWSGGSNNPSGAIPGAYYGTGINPNYGGNKPHRNDAEGGVGIISYNHDNTHNNGFNTNWNQQQQQVQPQQYYAYNNNVNNAWQRPNTNNYNNRPYNRYSPGSQGWYATGGNHWYNNGQSRVPYVPILMISILSSIIFTL